MKDKVVLVTGSSYGLGRHIAKAFAKKGAKVVLNTRGAGTSVLSCETVIEKGEAQSLAVFNVKNFPETERGMAKVVKELGTINILVNNAGGCSNHTIRKMPLLVWDEVIRTNLTGAFNCSKAALGVSNSLNRIINITSILGDTGVYGGANYAASKAGITGFTKSLALELAKEGITVNAVAPGYVDIGMSSIFTDKAINQIIEKTPMKRLGTAKEVAHAVLFLASKKASFITGQTINVNGGLYM